MDSTYSLYMQPLAEDVRRFFSFRTRRPDVGFCSCSILAFVV